MFFPYDGYFHTVPRIIALLSTLIPIKLIPLFIVIICYVIFVYIITLFFTSPYKWLFRSQFLTFTAALLLLLSPGQIEMLGNLTNMHWYLLLLLSIIALKDINENYTAHDLIVAFLCISTSGTSLILIPVFITRIIIKSKVRNKNKLGEYIIILVIIIFSIIHLIISKGSDIFYYPLILYIKIFVRHFFHFIIFHIFLGDHFTMQLHHFKYIYYPGTTIIFLLIFKSFIKNWEIRNILVVSLCICALFLPVLITMARPTNMLFILGFSNYDPHHWFRSRYSFYLPAISTIFWVFFLSRLSFNKWLGPVIITTILLVQILLNTHRFIVRKYTAPTDWFQKAALLEQSIKNGCPEKVRVNIAPTGWSLEITTRVKKNCDRID